MPNNFATTIPPSGLRFIIRNINTRKSITIFGLKINPGLTADLFSIPEIDEDIVKTSLTKGELKQKLEEGEIIIIESTLSLPFLDSTYRNFLINKGLPATTISGSSIATITNIAALQSLPNPNSTTLIQVQSNSCYYFFDPASSLTSDGYHIVNPPSGNGKWIRQQWGHEKWRSQASWFVDSINGNDENSGSSAGSPIKTIKELAYRLGGIATRQYTLTLLNNLAADDQLTQLQLLIKTNPILIGITSPTLRIIGQQTTVRTGTVTTAAIPVPASNLASQIQDTSVSDWTPDVGRLVVVTSGAVTGAMAWVLKDIGSNTARLSRWGTIQGFTSAAPSPGDTYKVVTLTTIPTGLPSLIGSGGTGGGSSSLFLAFESIDIPFTQFQTSDISYFFGCKFSGNMGIGADARINLFCSLLVLTSTTFVATTPSLLALTNSAILATTGTPLTFQFGATFKATEFINQGCTLSIHDNSTAQLVSYGAFDSPVGTGACITCQSFGYVSLQTSYYGTGNATGTQVLRGGKLFLVGGFVPTNTGTTELSFVGSGTAIPRLVAGAAVPAASALTTWAHWSAAPFLKSVVDYTSDSAIVGI